MLRRGPAVVLLGLMCTLWAMGAVGQDATPSEEAALQAYRQGAFSQAVQLYTKALSETDDAGHRARLHVRIAWTLFALGREDEVDTHLQAALVEDPNMVLIPDYYTQEFLVLFEQARHKAAAVADGRQPVPPPDLEATLGSVVQRLDSGEDLEGALGDAERLLASYPDDPRLPPLRLELLNRLKRSDEAGDSPYGGDGSGYLGSSVVARSSIPDLILRANRLLDEGDVETSLELLREAVSRQPSNVAALELMAEAARRAVRWQEASFALKSALALQPDNIGLQLRLGEVSLAMGDASAARDVFQQLTERYPHSDRAWAALGLLDARLGNLDRALDELEHALRENPLLPEVQLAHGELLLASGRVAEALEALRAASNLLHDDPQLEARLGQALLATSSAEAALGHLRVAAQGEFTPPDVQLALVLALIENGLHSEAQRVLEAVADDAAGDSRVLRGLLFLERGDPVASESDLAGVAQARPNAPAVLNLLAAALYRQDRFDDAVTYLIRAVEVAPNDASLAANLERARVAAAAVRLRDGALPVTVPPAE